jgi:hypothetical protein
MRQEIKELVDENRNRRQKIYGPYDQITGIGCYGFAEGLRKHIVIPDCMIPEMWVCKETLETGIYHEVLRYGSIKRFIEEGMQRDYTDEYHQYVEEALFQARCADDPEFAFIITDKIVDKVTGALIPFKIRYAQRKLLKVFEDLGWPSSFRFSQGPSVYLCRLLCILSNLKSF